MTDPWAPFVSPIITTASNLVKDHLAAAKAKDQNETTRLIKYLDAVAEAVKGLEAEADQLLSQALHMDWTEKDERIAFVRRCGGYLDVDNLRLDLERAVKGLDESRAALKDQMSKWSQKKSTRRRREAVLGEVDETLQRYRNYLIALEHGPKESGIAAGELNRAREQAKEAGSRDAAKQAQDCARPIIEASYAQRIGYEALGAIEALIVCVQDAFG